MQNRLTHIDGLRGIAALVVAFSHFLCAFYPATETFRSADVRNSTFEITISQTPFNLFYNGTFAVCVFFVISGYVLSISFFSLGNTESIYSSAYRRYIRLMIPVFVTSVLYYLFLQWGWFVTKSTPIVSQSWWLQKMWNTEPDLFHFVKSTFIDLLFHKTIEPPYNAALWSIGLEIKGSYLVYVFLLVMGKHKFKMVAYFLLFLITLKSYYCLFVAGMFIADIQSTNRLYILKYWQTVLLLAIVFYFGSYKITTETGIWTPLNVLIGIVKPQSIAAIILFYICLQSSWACTFFNKSVVVFFGNISYSLYLLHLLIIGSVSGLVFQYFYAVAGTGYFCAAVGSFLISITVIIIAAKICTIWIDEKGVELSKKFYRFLFR